MLLVETENAKFIHIKCRSACDQMDKNPMREIYNIRWWEDKESFLCNQSHGRLLWSCIHHFSSDKPHKWQHDISCISEYDDDCIAWFGLVLPLNSHGISQINGSRFSAACAACLLPFLELQRLLHCLSQTKSSYCCFFFSLRWRPFALIIVFR